MGEQARRPQSLHRGTPQRQVHPAPMNADLGDRVAGGAAARLGVDELAEAVEEAALAILYALARQRLAHAERGQLAHGVRQERDADTELSHLGCALVHAARKAALMERERQGEPTDAAA